MAIPIIHFWQKYFTEPHEGLGSTYERFIINDILDIIVKQYQINSVLEVPSFGFTGLSGINSLGLALSGLNVTVSDDDNERLSLIKSVWENFNTDVNLDLIDDFCHLPYPDNTFDMSWNFSAMWFVSDLEKFCSELIRVSKKVILIMVPNVTGLGYLQQKYFGKDDIKNLLKEDNIKPKNFISCLKKKGWRLTKDAYIDCPPWPDIGMCKEDFLKKFGLRSKKSSKKINPLTIITYYNKSELQMKKDMKKYDIFERFAPKLFKKFWAHHHYYLFMKTEEN